MTAWKKALISPEQPIKKAIEVIDRAGMQIALVVTAEGFLLGTVTDGDVRRAILKGVSLSARVGDIMQKKPIKVSQNEEDKQILTLMRQRQIHQLPVVDSHGRITGVKVVDDLMAPAEKKNWVILMAGGIGSRLSPLTDELPKPLIHVGNQPILETILKNFKDQGFKNFFISVNYKNEMVTDHFGDGSRWGVTIQYVHEDRRMGTAGALGLLPQRPKLPIIVMNGDLLTNVNFEQFLQFHAHNKAEATMSVREYDFQVPYGVVKIDGHNILNVQEKPVQKFFVNAGIYALSPSVFKYVPKNKPYHMTQLFDALIKRKRKVAAFPIREYWLDIGQMEDFHRANGDFTKFFDKRKPLRKRTLNTHERTH